VKLFCDPVRPRANGEKCREMRTRKEEKRTALGEGILNGDSSAKYCGAQTSPPKHELVPYRSKKGYCSKILPARQAGKFAGLLCPVDVFDRRLANPLGVCFAVTARLGRSAGRCTGAGSKCRGERTDRAHGVAPRSCQTAGLTATSIDLGLARHKRARAEAIT